VEMIGRIPVEMIGSLEPEDTFEDSTEAY